MIESHSHRNRFARQDTEVAGVVNSRWKVVFRQVLEPEQEPGDRLRFLSLQYGRQATVLWELHLWVEQRTAGVHRGPLP